MMPHIKRSLGHKNILILAIAYSIAITIVFFIPTGILVSDETLSKFKIPYIDKWVHGVLFFGLTCFWQLYIYIKGIGNKRTINTKLLFAVILSYGIVIEVLQGLLTVSRSADIYDVLADVVGSLLAILIFKFFKKYIST